MTTDTEQSHTLRHTAEEHTERGCTHNCLSVTRLESVSARQEVAWQWESCSKEVCLNLRKKGTDSKCDIHRLSQTVGTCYKVLLYASCQAWPAVNPPPPAQTCPQTLMASTESYLSSLLMWLVMLVLSGAAEMGWMTVASCDCCW